jgi:hypothetical protein
MRTRSLASVVIAVCLVAAAAHAAKVPWADRDHVVYTPARGNAIPLKGGPALKYHGGPTITAAKVVLIFWGASFGTANSPSAYAAELQSFRDQFGTTHEYNVITEYSGIQTTNLFGNQPDWFDSSAPPTNVTDAAVQGEVNRYLAANGSSDPSTIYEVVIPSTSYSSSGSSTSCGGPSLAYCAYHGWIGSGPAATKYSIEPYPSCGGCQVAGWTAAQNQEHFICHETREAVTDSTGTGWYDPRGYEADDKCAWSPSPFLGSGGFGYQYEWSNAAHGCVQSR